MKKERKINTKATKKKKNWSKILLISMLVLLALEVVLIPCLIYAEVKRILPIVAFLIIPTLLGIVILLLSRNCSVDYEKKKENLFQKN